MLRCEWHSSGIQLHATLRADAAFDCIELHATLRADADFMLMMC